MLFHLAEAQAGGALAMVYGANMNDLLTGKYFVIDSVGEIFQFCAPVFFRKE